MIVCYLHGQTGRFTFWEIANKSGLLRPISQKRQRKPQRAKTVVSPRSSPLKTFPQRRGARRNGCFRWLRKPETGFSDGFEEVELEFPHGAFRLG